LITRNPTLLEQFSVDAKDRQYHSDSYRNWGRNQLTVDIYREKVLLQKLDYIHHNPQQEKWHLCTLPEEHPWSSARFYHTGEDPHGLVSHYLD
jgi:putative transposase